MEDKNSDYGAPTFSHYALVDKAYILVESSEGVTSPGGIDHFLTTEL
jgi:hypothetical protein